MFQFFEVYSFKKLASYYLFIPTQSLKTNPKIPMASSMSRRIPTKTEYWKKQSFVSFVFKKSLYEFFYN